MNKPSTGQLSPDTGELMALLAFIYLQNNRPQKAMALLKVLKENGLADEAANGALVLALLRSGFPEAALTALEHVPLRVRLTSPFQLLRAQVMGALNRPNEAALAMRAFIDARADAYMVSQAASQTDSGQPPKKRIAANR